MNSIWYDIRIRCDTMLIKMKSAYQTQGCGGWRAKDTIISNYRNFRYDIQRYSSMWDGTVPHCLVLGANSIPFWNRVQHDQSSSHLGQTIHLIPTVLDLDLSGQIDTSIFLIGVFYLAHVAGGTRIICMILRHVSRLDLYKYRSCTVSHNVGLKSISRWSIYLSEY